VFDPLAISLVIAANFAFAQIKPKKQNFIKEEDNKIIEQLKTEKENKESNQPLGFPIMIDPKTGKFFYEEPDPENKNLDLDGDGVIEEEELQQVFDKSDTNNDGYIDEQEAKLANLSPELVDYLNKIKNHLEQIKEQTGLSIADNELNLKVNETKELIKQTLNKNNNDNTITYF
jgi:hypothetical protein